MEKPLLQRVAPILVVLPEGAMQRAAVPMLHRAFAAEGMPLARVESSVANGVDARRLMDKIGAIASQDRGRNKHIVLTLDARLVDGTDKLYLRGYMTMTRGGKSRQDVAGALHWFSAPLGGPPPTRSDPTARSKAWAADGARAFLAALDRGLGRIAHLTKLRLDNAVPTAKVEQLRFGDHMSVMVDAVEVTPSSVVYSFPPWVLVEEPRRDEQGYLAGR